MRRTAEDRREGVALWTSVRNQPSWWCITATPCTLASTVRVAATILRRDLAKGLRLSFEDAETVKMEYGCAAFDRLLGERAGGVALARRPRTARRALEGVSRILEARAVELFRFVRSEFAAWGWIARWTAGVSGGWRGQTADPPGCRGPRARMQTRYGCRSGFSIGPMR